MEKKRSWWIGLVLMLVLFVIGGGTSLVLGADTSIVDEDPEKVSGLLMLKNDWISPGEEDRDSYNKQRGLAYVHYQWFGAGIDGTYVNEDGGYTEFEPFVTVNPYSGPIYLVAGYSMRGGGYKDFNEGERLARLGIWYAEKFGKLRLFIDAKNYFEISDEAKANNAGYMGIFAKATYELDNVTPGLYVGGEADFNHWWAGRPGKDEDGRNSFLIGPLVGYKFFKQGNTSADIYLRPAYCWKDYGENDLRVRVGLRLNF